MSTKRVHSLMPAALVISVIGLTLITACSNTPINAGNAGNSLLGAAGNLQAEPTAIPTTDPTVAPTDEPAPPPQPTVTELTADTGAVQLPTTQAAALPEVPAYDVTELDVIARINEYRIQNGLWPLAPNNQLRDLAHLQANFAASLPEVPYHDMHAGASGEDAITRAGNNGWPSYSNPQQIAIAENAYAGANAGAAMEWWKGSDLHNRTMLNVGFREVGAAIVEHQGMKLIYVVFGSRPGVVPVLYDPNSGVVYISSERYKWSAGGSWIHDVTQVSVTQGGAAPTWSPYALSVPAPADPTTAFHVTLSDGATTLELDLNPRADIAWLPSTTNLNPAVAGADQPPPVVAAAPVEPPNIVLTYNETSLDITVVGSEPVDIIGLDIAGGGQMITSPMWNNPAILLSPMYAIPPGTCLQAWRYDVGVTNYVPSGCTQRGMVIYIMPHNVFWSAFDFEVRYKGITIANCAVGAGRCEAHIP